MKNSAPRLAANFSYYTIPEAKLQDLRERNGGKSLDRKVLQCYRTVNQVFYDIFLLF